MAMAMAMAMGDENSNGNGLGKSEVGFGAVCGLVWFSSWQHQRLVGDQRQVG